MSTMSRDHGKKLRQIRLAEKLTQAAFAELSGLALSTVKNYENGIKEVGLSIIDRVTNHQRFQKYTLWLMTDTVAPAAGQISPLLSPDGQDETKSMQSDHKAG